MDIDEFEWWYSEGEDQDAESSADTARDADGHTAEAPAAAAKTAGDEDSASESPVGAHASGRHAADDHPAGKHAAPGSGSFSRLWDEAEDAEAEDAATATLVQPVDMSISPAETPRPSHHIDPDETASFSILDVPAEGAKAPAPAPRPDLKRQGDARRSSPFGPIVVAFLAGVVACAAIGGVRYHVTQQSEEQAASEMSLERSLNRTRSVHLSISVEGGEWDTSRGDSQMLMQITGRTLKGQQVDERQYVDSNGSGIELKPGDYEITVSEEPVAIDGTRFRVSKTMVPVSFNSRAGDTVDTADNGTFDLHAIATGEVGQ